ncbi:EAL domain-containing protein [Vibrio viridaestus]|uniref:EAL domain-containing protein n=1 Tax=Vibrio viridaestus TaxID=2487322 RepID=A0A3N9TK23_9VIBR|nr:EAL domain-containing protein [Vibrio viridaestus]RQW64314.1 EAL domain-containing protein [Vibrio viridaestus]
MLMGIRTKFIFISTLSVVLCALAVFAVSVRQHQIIYLDTVESNLEALTSNVSDELLFYIGERDASFNIKNQLLIFQKYDHILLANVYDAQWNQIDQYVNLHSISKPRLNTILGELPDIKKMDYKTLQLKDVLVNLKPIGEASMPQGYLLVIHDFSGPISQSKTQLLKVASPIVLVLLLMTIGLTWVLFKRLLEPLLSLSQFTQDVERSGDYSLRVHIAGKDEVAALSHQVNSMLETINEENQLNEIQKQALITQQAALNKLANYDQLTGLPNRRNIMNALLLLLKKSRENDDDFAVLYFDIDSFKSFNDKMGHEFGDNLLRVVSNRVSEYLGPRDVLARLAGDEFLILLKDSKTIEEASDIAEKIVTAFSQPVSIHQWNISTTISIGISLASQAKYNLDTLISNSDVAMYYAKNSGRGQYRVFVDSMLRQREQHDQIVSLIPSAIEKEEFDIVYQPKVSHEGLVEGLEALLRWHSPVLGIVPPSYFIPIAEHGGKINIITQWVVSRVCADLQRLKQICGDNVVVSINLSSKDLVNAEMHDHILNELENNHQTIGSLQLEITESSYLQEVEFANRFFASIRRRGGSIALDDFGTGYSSLSYLTQIEIDTLKIDRQFISNALTSKKDDAILSTILELASKLNLHCCCEGIESPEHVRYVINKGNITMQGHYFSAPVSIELLQTVISDIEIKYKEVQLVSELNFETHIR